MNTDFLWVEEYRPKTIDDCILPTSLKTLFKSFIKKGELSNLLFSGTPGIGKTTVAKALCEELNCDWIMINGCLLYTSPSPRDCLLSRMPSSA